MDRLLSRTLADAKAGGNDIDLQSPQTRDIGRDFPPVHSAMAKRGPRSRKSPQELPVYSRAGDRTGQDRRFRCSVVSLASSAPTKHFGDTAQLADFRPRVVEEGPRTSDTCRVLVRAKPNGENHAVLQRPE